MGFLDNLDGQNKRDQEGEEVVAALRKKALEALAGLLGEIRACFGDDPKAHGIQISDAAFPVQDHGARYQAPGLKIHFDPRRFIQVQPGGMAGGGFRVDIHFHGCRENHSHTLLYAAQEGREDRVWAFLRKDAQGLPVLTPRWSKDEFEAILNRQVIGQAPTLK